MPSPQLDGGLLPVQPRRWRRAGRLWTATPPAGPFSLLSTDFDGAGQFATIGDETDRFAFDFRDTAMSASCWFKTTTLGKVLWGKNGSALNGYRMTLQGGNDFQFIARGGLGTDRIVVTSATVTADDDAWHHLLLTMDTSGNGSGVTFYYDGVVLTPTIGDNGLISITKGFGDFVVADRDFDAPGPAAWVGLLDEVAIYQVELSAGEAAAVYGGGRPPDLRTVGPFLNGMIGYWFMGDLDTFPIIKNRSNPAPYAPNTTTVEFNEPLDFPNGAYLGFTNYAAVDFGKNDTFCAGGWVKFTSGPASRFLIGKSLFDGGDLPGWVVLVQQSPPGGVNFELRDSIFDRMVVSQNASSPAALSDDEWHHVCVTYGGGNSRANMRIFIDGAASGVSTSSNSSITGSMNNTGPLQVGAGVVNNFFHFEGGLQHTHVYNVVPTDEQIKSAFGSGVPQDLNALMPALSGNLVHWCAIGDGDASGAGNMIDLSGNGANGTIINIAGTSFVSDVGTVGGVGSDLTMISMAADDFVADTP